MELISIIQVYHTYKLGRIPAIYTVYQLKNNVNGKLYCGITRNLKKRLSGHRSNAKLLNTKMLISRAISKYGWENFSCDVIGEYDSLEECAAREVAEIARYKEQSVENYNTHPGGTSGLDYRTMSDSKVAEWRHNLSRARIGKRISEETRKKISIARKSQTPPMLGRSHSEETKRKISAANKGKVLSKSTRKKIGEANRRRCQRHKSENYNPENCG